MTMMQQAAARTPERGSVSAPATTQHSNFQHYLETFGLMTMVGISASLLAAPTFSNRAVVMLFPVVNLAAPALKARK